MKVIANIVAALLLLAVSASATEVICIGLNECDNSAKYKPLKCAENDATEVAKILKEQGNTITLLTQAQATREKVMEALAKKDAIVYFAGHGEKGELILSDGQIKLSELSGASPLVLLDCCYVGSGLHQDGNTRVFAAAQYEAFESDGHGLFTKYLLKWLKDGKSLNDEEEMLSYIKKGIAKETGGWQRPVLGYI